MQILCRDLGTMHSSRVHKSRSITGSEALPGLVPLGRIGDLAGEVAHFGE